MICRNPQHPVGRTTTMTFLEEANGIYVFACQACKEVNRKLSVQMVTAPALRRMVKQKLMAEGRMMLSAPPVVRPNLYRQKKRKIEWNGRRSEDGRYELVLYRQESNGELKVQMAIDGKLCPMLDDHIASREVYKTDSEYFTRIAESSELMLHLYGDARNPLPQPEVDRRQNQTF